MIQRCHTALVWGRAPSPVQTERSSAFACGHSNLGFAGLQNADRKMRELIR